MRYLFSFHVVVEGCSLVRSSVERCLEMCGLVDYADAVAGSLNVEFRKRLTIAVELVAKVSVILYIIDAYSPVLSLRAATLVTLPRRTHIRPRLSERVGYRLLPTRVGGQSGTGHPLYDTSAVW